jgi:hypothetical protein
MTVTPLSPMTKPILAMSPWFSGAHQSDAPALAKTPGAISWTGRGASAPARVEPIAASVVRIMTKSALTITHVKPATSEWGPI